MLPIDFLERLNHQICLHICHKIISIFVLMFTCMHSILNNQRNRSYIYIIYDIHDYFLQTVFRLCDLFLYDKNASDIDL